MKSKVFIDIIIMPKLQGMLHNVAAAEKMENVEDKNFIIRNTMYDIAEIIKLLEFDEDEK